MRRILFLILLLLPAYVGAVTAGDVVDSSFGLLDITTQVFLVICATLGFGLLLLSFFRYRDYKENPTQTHLSTVVLWFVLSLMFFGICALIVYDNQVAPARPAETIVVY